MTMNTSTPTDSELLTRFVRHRDEAAFTQLVHQYQALVIGAALRRTGNLETAKDVAQTVFVSLARRATLLMGHRKLAGWLYQAASYTGARMWDAERRRIQRHEQSALHEARNEVDLHWEELERALQSLSPSERQVLVLHYFQERSYAEMAMDLGMNEAAVRKRVSRAVQSLGAKLQRSGVRSSALALITGAVAAQSALPAQASVSVAVLSAAAGGSNVPWGLTLSALTSNTFIKVSLLTAALTAVPLAWQHAENESLRQEIATLVKTPPATTTAKRVLASRPSSSVSSASIALADLQKERVIEEAKLVSLRRQARRLQDEVVVSFGHVDDIAGQFAEVARLMQQVKAADAANRAALGKEFMAKLTRMLPALSVMTRISHTPALNARLHATLVASMAGLGNDERDQLEHKMLPHMQALIDHGLTFDKRPASRSEDWDRRYFESLAQVFRCAEPMLPVTLQRSELWQGLVSANQDAEASGFLDLISLQSDSL